MKSGVYKITIGDYFYFGSSRNLSRRRGDHIYKLKLGIHGNRFMQRAFNKTKDFSFVVLRYLDEKLLFEEEQKLIDAHSNERNCLNISTVADCPSRCDKFRKRLSEKNKTRVWTNDMREKAARAKKGKKHESGIYRIRSEKWVGANNPNAKLSEADRMNLIEERKSGKTIEFLAEKFHVHTATIGRICSKAGVFYKPKTWSDKLRAAQKAARIRTPQSYRRNNFGTRNPRAKLNEESVSIIREMLSNNEKPIVLAEKFQVSVATIRAIKSGRIWTK